MRADLELKPPASVEHHLAVGDYRRRLARSVSGVGERGGDRRGGVPVGV